MIKKILFYFHNRKLRLDILSLFMALLLISSLIIVSFSYFKNRNAVVELSRGTINRVSALIQEKVFRIVDNLQKLVFLSEIFLTDFSTVSLKNQPLIEFLHAAVTAYPKLQSLYLGDIHGNFMQVVDLTIGAHGHYLLEPTKRLPKNIAYGLRIIERSDQSTLETWYYKDKDFKTIEQESSSSVTFDPRNRPWYQGAKARRKLYWSDFYPFHPTGELGISVAVPSFDQQGHFIGVIGADLPLNIFSTFLTEQQIGKTGKAFILNLEGNVLLPPEPSPYQKIVTQAYQEWVTHNFSKQISSSTKKREEQSVIQVETAEHDFLFEVDGVDYLACVDHFSIGFEKNWLIAVIAPFNDFFGTIVQSQRETLLVTLAILILSSILVIYFSKRISTPIVHLAHEIDKIKHLDLSSEIDVHSHIREINLLSNSIASMRMMLRSFGRYVPKEIVKQLLQQGQEITLGGEKKVITVLFSDIANFTTIAESYPPELVMPLLENYFDELSRIILNAQGTIDKYIGDSIMAFWGAPLEIVDHERWACSTALACQKALILFNKGVEKEGKPLLETRIGIHTGRVIVGNIGTSERMNYTIMGDVVNTAARLQQVNKIYHTKIIISDELCQKISKEFLVRPLDIVAVKGKKEKIKIYELVEQYQRASPQQIELCTLFTQAYEIYHQGSYQEAKALFLKINSQFPDDFPTTFYLSQLEGEGF